MNCNDCCYNLPRDGHPYCTYEDGECIKISILEKENAELKKQVEQKQHLADVRLEQRIDVDIALEDTIDKLTKAKEIIKELMSFSVQLCDCRHTVDFEKTREEAEQFINSSEKPNS